MRIISHFHDFYDSVQKQGMDKDIVYLREHKELEMKTKYELGYHRSSSNKFQGRMHLLGYCGRIIRIFEIFCSVSNTSEYFYSFEEFKKEAIFTGAVDPHEFKWKFWRSKYQTFAGQDVSRLSELFHEYQVPLFLLSASDKRKGHVLILNPNLKKFQFQKQKDPYTTYQDIFQYISGVLNSPENKTVKISDKDKIHKHGFDKWSFRRMPKDSK